MKRPFPATVWREGKWFVSQCLEVDVASQGRTEEEALENLKEIQGLTDKLGPLGVSHKESPEQQVSAAEFILEGLHAHKRIGRNEERLFKAGEKKPEPAREKSFEPDEKPYRQRRQFN